MDIQSLLEQSDFFRAISPAGRRAIAAICIPRTLRKREMLFMEGETGHSMYLMAQGAVQLFKTSAEGRRSSSSWCGRGRSSARWCSSSRTVFPVSACALTAGARSFSCRRSSSTACWRRRSSAASSSAMLLAKQRYLSDQIFRLSALDVEQRFFHFLRDQYGEREEYSIDVTKRDVAAAIDALPETLSRLLLKLKDDGTVQWDGEKLPLRKGFWKDAGREAVKPGARAAPRGASRPPAAVSCRQFLLLSTRRFLAIQGIMERSFSPTFSSWCAAPSSRMRRKSLRPLLFSAIHFLANSPFWISESTFFISFFVSSLMMRGPDHVVTVLGRVGHGVAHEGEAAFVDQVHDELHLVDALEVGHLGGVARLHERLEARLHEVRHAAAEDRLLAEEVRLRLLAEARLDDARLGAADGQARTPARSRRALPVGSCAMAMRQGTPKPSSNWRRTVCPGPLGATMATSTSGGGTIWPKWMLNPCANSSVLPGGQAGLDVRLVDVALEVIGDEHHHDVGPFHRLGRFHALSARLPPPS